MKALVIGGGIGGLAAALSLHAAGIEVQVFEQAEQIRELGVGINLLPHAVEELAELGLLERLDATGVRTAELIYANRFGQPIWREPRGVDAGYAWPQFSIHRGHLQGLLHRAVEERIGTAAVHLGLRLTAFREDPDGVTARFADCTGGGPVVEHPGDVLVGADGIHSAVRSQLYPDEGPPSWNGHMLWRGCVEGEPFLTGRSMIIAGDLREKVVLYPVARDALDRGRSLTNWAAWVKLGDGSTPPPRREDWSRHGDVEEALPHFSRWRFDWFDIPSLMRRTPVCYEYPMCDRDPLERWSFGRVTLLGDAAHPMYPVGSNGAAQAILDGRTLARTLVDEADPVAALRAYEAERLPAVNPLVLNNRKMGPERVIDIVAARAPDGFQRLDDVVSQAELEAIAAQYRQAAGMKRVEPGAA